MAVRYPKGGASTEFREHREPIETGKAEILQKGKDVALLAVGAMVPAAAEASAILEKEGIRATLVNVRFVKPFDRELIRQLSSDHRLLVTLEENVEIGGFGQQVQAFAGEECLPVEVCIAAVPDLFVGHGSVAEQRKQCGLDGVSVAERIRKRLADMGPAGSGRKE